MSSSYECLKISAHQTWYSVNIIQNSKLGYRAIIYGSEQKSYLKILEPVANQLQEYVLELIIPHQLVVYDY